MAKNLVEVIISFVKKGTGDTDAKTGLSKLSAGFKELTGFSISSATALGVLGLGLKKVIDFSKQSVAETVAYNKQIREMTQVTGLGAEEISRIVQVGDDWGVSIDAIRTSLAFMNKSGLSPSIDNLAALADEYVNTTDKAAFAEKAVKVLGRGYQTLIPLLALGGKGFREAAAGIDDSMLATEDNIKASRDYEVAVDDLSDSVTGLSYKLGNELLPPLTKITKGLNELLTANLDSAEAVARLQAAHEAGLITDKELAIAIRDIRTGQKSAIVVMDQYSTEMSDLTSIETEENRLLAARQSTIQKATVAQNLYNDAIDGYIKRSPLFLQQYAAFTKAQEDAIQKTKDDEQAIKDLNTAMSNLNSAINGQLGPAQEDFIKSQLETKTQIDELNVAMNDLIADGYDPLGEKVMELRGKHDELIAKYDEDATAHEDATHRIMFDMLEQKMAMDGLTSAEITSLQNLAVAWGLPDQATLNYQANMEEAVTWLADHPGDTAGFEAILSGQATAWQLTADQAQAAKDQAAGYVYEMSLLKDKTVTITTIHHDILENAFAEGGDFVVPPGFENDTFPMHVSSGEHVIVEPAGSTFNINMSGYGNAGQDLMSTVRLLEQIYG